MIEYRGTWPVFGTAPPTTFAEVPERSFPSGSPTSAETRRSVASDFTIARMLAGFVCGLWIWFPPLGE